MRSQLDKGIGIGPNKIEIFFETEEKALDEGWNRMTWKGWHKTTYIDKYYTRLLVRLDNQAHRGMRSY